VIPVGSDQITLTVSTPSSFVLPPTTAPPAAPPTTDHHFVTIGYVHGRDYAKTHAQSSDRPNKETQRSQHEHKVCRFERHRIADDSEPRSKYHAACNT
jgi:hypothetical protein